MVVIGIRKYRLFNGKFQLAMGGHLWKFGEIGALDSLKEVFSYVKGRL